MMAMLVELKHENTACFVSGTYRKESLCYNLIKIVEKKESKSAPLNYNLKIDGVNNFQIGNCGVIESSR